MGNSFEKRAKMDKNFRNQYSKWIYAFRILPWECFGGTLFQVVVFLIQLVLVLFCPEPNIPLPLVFNGVFLLQQYSARQVKTDDYWWKVLLSYAILAIGTGVLLLFFFRTSTG